jgi:hypothetical protein
MGEYLQNRLFECIPAICVAVGVFVGAWINWRARTSQSPLPSLPAIFQAKEKPEDDSKSDLPQAKSGMVVKP